MRIRLDLFLIGSVCIKLFGLALFLCGYFPVRNPVEGQARFQDQPRSPLTNTTEADGEETKPTPVFGRLVVVLIDALRADFVLPVESNLNLPRMRFVEKLIVQRETISFRAKANPPTVTLPKIKALTSGSIPGFVDVVLNFDSQSLQDDNIISQLYKAGKKMVFYGDDTWIRLFPEHFLRSEGTTSFFVTDYTEVDNNVTRHLEAELGPSDWDVLILHYLGLDHIGHLAGPLSPLAPVKLQEMDDIVKWIYQSVSEQDKKRDLPTLLLLCGDHGMSEQGSHGGSSPSETVTPVVFLSSVFQQSKGLDFSGDPEVQQIDVVPTLSSLLGVPIPQNSLGIVIPETLRDLPTEEQLGVLHANAQQLKRVYAENVPGHGKDDAIAVSFERAVRMHTSWLQRQTREAQLGVKIIGQYVSVMATMRDSIAASLTKYDLHSIGVAISIIWMVLVSLCYGYSCCGHGRVRISLGLHGSFFLLFIFGLLSVAHAIECTGGRKTSSQLLCSEKPEVQLLVALIILWSSFFCAVVLVEASRLTSGLVVPVPDTALSGFLFLGTVAHALTLLSSSFVEEEHQTWYFYTQTAMLLLLGHALFTFREQCKALERHRRLQAFKEMNSQHVANKSSISDLHCALYKQAFQPRDVRNCEASTSCDKPESVRSRSDTAANNPSAPVPYEDAIIRDVMASDKERIEEPSLKPAALVVAAMVLSRLCRKWNQTGDKWAHLPDLGDWLTEPDNKTVLSALSAVALLVTVISRRRENTAYVNLLVLTGCAAVYCFRAANGAFLLPLLYEDSALSKGILEARVAFVIISIILINALIDFVKNDVIKVTNSSRDSVKLQTGSKLAMLFHGMKNAWIVLMVLLMRPHNVTLVMMTCLQEMCIRVCLIRLKSSFSTTSLTLLYLWMGQATFFYQGNSNSLATVDVSAGYIGLDDYQPVLIGLLMALSTYSGPLFWVISLFRVLLHCDGVVPEKTRNCDERAQKQQSLDLLEVCFVLALTRALPVAVYTVLVTAQRYHLFVWTVFSPKLLYEGMHTVIVSVIIFCVLLIRVVFCKA